MTGLYSHMFQMLKKAPNASPLTFIPFFPVFAEPLHQYSNPPNQTDLIILHSK